MLTRLENENAAKSMPTKFARTSKSGVSLYSYIGTTAWEVERVLQEQKVNSQHRLLLSDPEYRLNRRPGAGNTTR